MKSISFKAIFKINYQTSYGENVFIAGSVPELGNWIPEKAFPLSYKEVFFLSLFISLSRMETGPAQCISLQII